MRSRSTSYLKKLFEERLVFLIYIINARSMFRVPKFNIGEYRDGDLSPKTHPPMSYSAGFNGCGNASSRVKLIRHAQAAEVDDLLQVKD
jgi:hypothetical protein